MNRLKPNSNLICNLVWQSNVQYIKWIFSSSEKKKVRKTDNLWNFLSPRAITPWKMGRSKPNSNLICNLVWQSNVPNIKWISLSSEKTVRKTDNLWNFLSPRAITQWNMGRSKPNSNLICNLVWQSNVPNIKWISASTEKKSAENWFTGLTDWRTDRQTDGQTDGQSANLKSPSTSSVGD